MSNEAGEGAESAGFTAKERAAMKERAAELRAEAKRAKLADKAAAEKQDQLDVIAAMQEPDKSVAERLAALVAEIAPELAPRTWYSQPAWAKDGKTVCFFRSGIKDGERYSTFGFSREANLDSDDGIWPTSYALAELTKAGEARIRELLANALS